MTNGLKSKDYDESKREDAPASGWLKVGAIAVASALAGGLAASWWYRKTLTRLRQAEENGTNPEYGNSGDDPADEA